MFSPMMTISLMSILRREKSCFFAGCVFLDNFLV